MCNMLFSDNFHGMGMQMTSNGTGIYYKPGIDWRKNTQILGDIGVHFSNHGHQPAGLAWSMEIVQFIWICQLS